MSKILYFAGNTTTAKMVKEYFQKRNHLVRITNNEDTLFDQVEKLRPTVVIFDDKPKSLDIGDVVRYLKKIDNNIIIIFVTDADSNEKITGYRGLGADDFIIRPISLNKLFSRIKFAETKPYSPKGFIKAGGLKIDQKKYQADYNGVQLKLTPQEFRLLKYLIQNKNQVITRQMILSRVWKFDSDVQSRAVDVYIGYLRRKFKKLSLNDLQIKTVQGFGYMLQVKKSS